MLVYWRHTLPIFRELGYAPIDVKFPPITALHVLYTVLKKISEFVKNYFINSYFDLHKLFLCEKTFLDSFYDMVWTIFHLFQYCNITTDWYVRTSVEKKFEKMTLKFFLTVLFRVFFHDFLHIWSYILGNYSRYLTNLNCYVL